MVENKLFLIFFANRVLINALLILCLQNCEGILGIYSIFYILCANLRTLSRKQQIYDWLSPSLTDNSLLCFPSFLQFLPCLTK